ncbi:MAG: protein kinase [Parachlamydiaceae bacterium]|nr:protein kinase [Parachlamydiaceae bacterium]
MEAPSNQVRLDTSSITTPTTDKLVQTPKSLLTPETTLKIQEIFTELKNWDLLSDKTKLSKLKEADILIVNRRDEFTKLSSIQKKSDALKSLFTEGLEDEIKSEENTVISYLIKFYDEKERKVVAKLISMFAPDKIKQLTKESSKYIETYHSLKFVARILDEENIEHLSKSFPATNKEFQNKLFNTLKSIGLALSTRTKPTPIPLPAKDVESLDAVITPTGEIFVKDQSTFLGKGGSKTVHKAVKLQDKTKYVWATIHNEAENFRLELKFLELLAHTQIPNIVAPYIPGYGYEILQKKYGRSSKLFEKMEKGIMNQRLQVFQGIGNALKALHKNGIVHLDIKPDNILYETVGSNKVGRLSDFGAAKKKGETIQVYTELYKAPEMKYKGPADPISDCFSLGVSILEGVTGKCDIITPRGLKIYCYTGQREINKQIESEIELLKKSIDNPMGLLGELTVKLNENQEKIDEIKQEQLKPGLTKGQFAVLEREKTLMNIQYERIKKEVNNVRLTKADKLIGIKQLEIVRRLLIRDPSKRMDAEKATELLHSISTLSDEEFDKALPPLPELPTELNPEIKKKVVVLQSLMGKTLKCFSDLNEIILSKLTDSATMLKKDKIKNMAAMSIYQAGGLVEELYQFDLVDIGDLNPQLAEEIERLKNEREKCYQAIIKFQ